MKKFFTLRAGTQRLSAKSKYQFDTKTKKYFYIRTYFFKASQRL